MVKRVMKIRVNEVWERYKFSIATAFTVGMITGLLIAMGMIKLGSALM